MHQRVSVAVALIAAIFATGCATSMPGVPPRARTKSAPLASAPSTTRATRRESRSIPALGLVTASKVNVTASAGGQLTSIVDGRPVKAGELLATIESPQCRAPLGRGINHRSENRNGRAETVLSNDECAVAKAPHLLTVQVRAPISGLVGFRKVDPRNFVHAGETLLTITQLHPIAVVFPISEQYLPRVRALLGTGATPVVELFDRTGTVRLATGHLAEIDNEIDETTGTIKLKAYFDNKDGELFPNQFVNVRLVLGALETHRH